MGRYKLVNIANVERRHSPRVCPCCGMMAMVRTVRLIDPNGVAVWRSTHCAAKLLGVSATSLEGER